MKTYFQTIIAGFTFGILGVGCFPYNALRFEVKILEDIPCTIVVYKNSAVISQNPSQEFIADFSCRKEEQVLMGAVYLDSQFQAGQYNMTAAEVNTKIQGVCTHKIQHEKERKLCQLLSKIKK